MIPFLPEDHPLQRAALDPVAVLWGQHLNERQRIFAVAIMEGKPRAEALAVAGFEVAPGNRDSRASHLLAHPTLKKYMAALRQALWQETAFRVQNAMNVIKETREQATEAGLSDVLDDLDRIEQNLHNPLD